MVKKNQNGGAKNVDPFKDQKIEFPVTFELKAVMVEDGNHAGNKEKLEAVFSKQHLVYKFVADKVSSKGSYVSYTYSITLDSKQQMEKLYEDLKEVEGLKFAL